MNSPLFQLVKNQKIASFLIFQISFLCFCVPGNLLFSLIPLQRNQLKGKVRHIYTWLLQELQVFTLCYKYFNKPSVPVCFPFFFRFLWKNPCPFSDLGKAQCAANMHLKEHLLKETRKFTSFCLPKYFPSNPETSLREKMQEEQLCYSVSELLFFPDGCTREAGGIYSLLQLCAARHPLTHNCFLKHTCNADF